MQQADPGPRHAALGLELDGELLALACASHSGEAFHIDGVRRILASAGLDETALQTPPDFPLDEAAKEAFIRAGLDKQPIAMNCSGKHAAMLVTCVGQRLGHLRRTATRSTRCRWRSPQTFAETDG